MVNVVAAGCQSAGLRITAFTRFCPRAVPAAIAGRRKNSRRPPGRLPGRSVSFRRATVGLVIEPSLTAAPPLSRQEVADAVLSKGTASDSEHMPLLSPVVAFLLRGHSRNRSGKCARRGKKDGVARVVGQHRHYRLGQRQDARRSTETAGSTCDLKGHSTVALLHEIDAITSPRENDL